MSHVTIPATGTGDTTPQVATDQVAGAHFQFVKIADGTVGGSQGAAVDTFGRLQVAGYLGASVTNFPAVQPVSGTLTASVIGEVGASVTNWPTTQAVSGNVTASVIGEVGASITNLPANQGVTVASTSVTQPVSGTLTASVIGEVGASIVNFPANQQVTIASASITQPVSGNVTASIAGYIGASITDFPANQSVTVASTSVTQPISGNVGASSTNFGGSVTAYPAAAAAGGASPFHFISGASVNNVNVKSAAGTVYAVNAMNVTASPRYLRLYDKSSVPSVGQDVPRQTYVIPGGSFGAAVPVVLPAVGLLFGAGIGIGITAGSMGDTCSTVTALGDVVVNLGYF